MTETREIRGCCPLDCQDTCAWVAEVEDGRVVRVSDSTSKRGQTTKPPEPFDSEGLSGSGGGIREQPSAAKAARRAASLATPDFRVMRKFQRS